MSNDSNRGWNIVGRKARRGWVARLMGARKEGEPPYLVVIGLLIAAAAYLFLV